MISKIKTLIKFFLSFISIIKLNALIFFYKLLKPKKEIIFIYHPTRSLTFNNKNYLEKLFSDYGNNYLIINGHQIDKIKEKNYFFIIHNIFLKFIFGVDIFFSTYLSDDFTPNSIKIYMHHDIYDTPLANDNKLEQFYKRIVKYDYLFLPTKQSNSMFKNLFLKFNQQSKDINPKLIETGYYKLDFLKNKSEIYKKKEQKNIVIAPTNYFISPEFCFNNLEEIINVLLNKTDYNIIYRPHPANWKNQEVLNISDKFKNSKKFIYDNSTDYFEIYMNSICMITDLSGTAYTYSLFTKNPVIFFSHNENSIKYSRYNELSYFKDRTKIGLLTENLDQLINSIFDIENVISQKINSIKELEKNITYLGTSKNRIKDLIDKLIKYKIIN